MIFKSKIFTKSINIEKKITNVRQMILMSDEESPSVVIKYVFVFVPFTLNIDHNYH